MVFALRSSVVWGVSPTTCGSAPHTRCNPRLLRRADTTFAFIESHTDYAFRIAISNSRLERFENGQVTFGYRDRKTQEQKHPTLSAEEFIRRFLRHVLPKGLVKVRSYGLWSGVNGDKLKKARALLTPEPPAPQAPALRAEAQPPASTQSPPRCPQCESGHLIWIASLLPQHSAPLERWPQQTRAP
jgi:hypothetical protein